MAQQQAEARALVDAWCAGSPEGSLQQWQSDRDVRNTLTQAQMDALNDVNLGIPLTPDEQKATASMSRDQSRAVTRLATMENWLNEQLAASQVQVQMQQQQLINAQEAQRKQLLEAYIVSHMYRPPAQTFVPPFNPVPRPTTTT